MQQFASRLACATLVLSLISPAPSVAGAAAKNETVDEAICRLIDSAAKQRHIPIELFARLIWRESAFRIGAVSPKGAQGIAQFMPGTAAERGLDDPFDPEQAIPQAARLLADLDNQFGNFGLAAAAYNSGPARVRAFLSDGKGLPDETRRYVYAITGHSAEDWASRARGAPTDSPRVENGKPRSCMEVTASLRRGRAGEPQLAGFEMPRLAPWGIQLAGNFSKAAALRSFERASSTYARVIGSVRPMIIGTIIHSRGSRPYYRVRVPAETRQAAEAVCNKIRTVGGSCVVLKS